jgi:hypothetical protein
MTYDEVVAQYESMGLRGRVWVRSEIANTDPALHRGQEKGCMCGGCWPRDSVECVCGDDMVRPGDTCLTCGRPWWCES